MSPLRKQLELWHLLLGLAIPFVGGVWQFSAFYTRMNALEAHVVEISRDVKTMNNSVQQLIGKINK